MLISGVFESMKGRYFFYFFSGSPKTFQEKNPMTFSELPWTISGRNMKNFDFSSCAKYLRFRSVLVDIPS